MGLMVHCSPNSLSVNSKQPHWGPNSFQNDWALDWIADLIESGDESLISSTLDQVMRHGGDKITSPILFDVLRGRTGRTEDRLSARVSSHAIAAAEIIAARVGNPAEYLPDSLAEWLRSRPADQVDEKLRSSASKAVEIIESNSELQEFWDEGGSKEWQAAMDDLARRLRSTDPE